MKIVVIFIFFYLLNTAMAESYEEIESEVLIFLGAQSSLKEKAKGLAMAKKINRFNINESLVEMLDDSTPRGRICSHTFENPAPKGEVCSHEAIEAPWMEALHILLRKFPESKIKPDPDFNYNPSKKDAFKLWWLKNHERIVYEENGSYYLKEIAPHEELLEKEVKKSPVGDFPESTDLSAATNDLKSALENETKVDGVKKNKQPIWIIAGVMLLGTLLLLFKAFKGKSTS